MRIGATIEARMGSTRLPGKVLLPAAGKTMLAHLIDRLKQVPSLHAIVLATTTNATDDGLIDLAKREGIQWWRGSEEDVLGRVLDAARSVSADVIVETLGDCPILDPQLVEQVIQTFLHNECDYAGNSRVRCYPRGMDVQVFATVALARSAALTNDPADREHVSVHIHDHQELFRQINLIAPPDLTWPELGLTLDTQEDYLFLKRIIEHFGESQPYFGCRDVIELLRGKPEWVAMNASVQRRG
ncbi:MAG: glycosyltransferase family protein [Candidatus Andersenbacteria bacterium]|nr:glycosyltransferase family protein [Candidatus Andersenbacteria bacterium]